jgi:hypothetical protein
MGLFICQSRQKPHDEQTFVDPKSATFVTARGLQESRLPANHSVQAALVVSRAKYSLMHFGGGGKELAILNFWFGKHSDQFGTAPGQCLVFHLMPMPVERFLWTIQ